MKNLETAIKFLEEEYYNHFYQFITERYGDLVNGGDIIISEAAMFFDVAVIDEIMTVYSLLSRIPYEEESVSFVKELISEIIDENPHFIVIYKR